MIIDWVIENKEWIFSGVGISVIFWILKRTKTSTEQISSTSASINTGNIENAGRDLVIQNIVGGTLPHPVNLKKEDTKHDWRVYEVAFLWFDLEPPGIAAHEQQMSREVQEMKLYLHRAIEEGRLRAKREERYLNGITRYLGREELVRFAKEIGQKPKFLFREMR